MSLNTLKSRFCFRLLGFFRNISSRKIWIFEKFLVLTLLVIQRMHSSSSMMKIEQVVLSGNLHGYSHHTAPRECATAVRGPHFCSATYSEVWRLLWQSLTVCLSKGPSVCHTRESIYRNMLGTIR